MRPIDADALGLTDMEIIMCDGDYKEALKILIDKIEHAPTIEPKIKIIRCKDCKYWDTDYGLYGFCGRHGYRFSTFREGYCYMADKRHVIGGKQHETD